MTRVGDHAVSGAGAVAARQENASSGLPRMPGDVRVRQPFLAPESAASNLPLAPALIAASTVSLPVP